MAKKKTVKCANVFCDKMATKTCKHCNEQYCDEHIEPTKPGMPERGSWERGDDEELIADKSNHACPEYVDYLERKEKREKMKYRQALDNALNTPIKQENLYTLNKKSVRDNKLIKYLMCAGFLVGLILFFFFL